MRAGEDQPAARSERIAHGDSRPRALLESAGERLGEGLANLANLFDPDLIIIGGEGVAVGEVMLRSLRLALQRRRLIKTALVEFLIDT